MKQLKLSSQIAVLSLASTCTALSQAAVMLEEVVVTAQKRSQSQQDVPIAITALSANDIERLGATNVKDIQFSAPNLVVAGGNPVNQRFSIRGISDRGRNPGYDLRVGVYVDGVWVGKSAASNQSSLDVESIEILRGPQGTLFGKNTVAGAINITTKKPTDEFHGNVELGVGNYGASKLKAAVNVPFSDTVRGKLSVIKDTRDGYVDNLASGDAVSQSEYNDKDEEAVRAQLVWDAGDQTEVMLTFDHLESSANDLLAGERLGDPLAPSIREVSLDGASSVEVEGVGGYSLQVNHSLANGFELTSITASRYEDWNYQNFDEDYTPLALAESNTWVESSHITQEIRLASPANEKFDYVVGLYYLDQEIDGIGDASVDAFAVGAVPSPGLLVLGVNYDTTVTVESWAAFAHFNYRFNDQLQLTGGVRYTEEDKDIDFIITDNSGFFVAPAATVLTTEEVIAARSSDDLSPKISLNWFVNDDIMVYGGYSKAFKSGGYNADFIADANGLEFDDESVDAYELGIKSTWAEGRLRINAAVFESNHSDFQVQAQTPIAGGGSILTVSNAGELTSQGFEIDAQFLPTDWLRVWGSYGYTDAEFDSFEGCSIGGGIGSCAGNRPTEAPKQSYNFGAEVTSQVAGGEAFANLNYFWRDELYSNPNNEAAFLNEDHSELSGRVGWNSLDGEWSVYLWGKNLTDEETQVFNGESFLNYGRAIYNMPRMYGVTVSKAFGSN